MSPKTRNGRCPVVEQSFGMYNIYIHRILFDLGHTKLISGFSSPRRWWMHAGRWLLILLLWCQLSTNMCPSDDVHLTILHPLRCRVIERAMVSINTPKHVCQRVSKCLPWRIHYVGHAAPTFLATHASGCKARPFCSRSPPLLLGVWPPFLLPSSPQTHYVHYLMGPPHSPLETARGTSHIDRKVGQVCWSLL